MKKILLLLSTLFIAHSFNAQTTITGTVLDESGEPLIGANIYTKNLDGMGVATDFDGSFSLDVPYVPISLVVSYLGFVDQVIEANGLENVNITLAQYSILTECYISCCWGASRDIKIGPSHDFINQSSGLMGQLQLPYLFSISPKLFIDGNWNFTNDVRNLNLRIERYDMPRIGRIGTSLVGKYRRINATSILNLDQRILGGQFNYKGFELMVGYGNQKIYHLKAEPVGPKNIGGDAIVERGDGFHTELSKSVFGIFFQSEITLIKGIGQYAAKAQYYIPGSQIRVNASWEQINGFQSGILGVMYRVGL